MFPANFCRTCGKVQSFLTGYCDHRPDYIKLRDRKLDFYVALASIGVMALVWGVVIWVSN